MLVRHKCYVDLIVLGRMPCIDRGFPFMENAEAEGEGATFVITLPLNEYADTR